MSSKKITTIFLDIGGVLLTNGWGYEARSKAVAHFKLDNKKLNERHHLTFDTYEEGKLTLNEYLKRVVFYEPRSFSEQEFITFMFDQSLPYPETINFFKEIKKLYNLKIIAVSNEGRELNAYRIKQFKLNELFDAFVSSSFVHMRKPDADIFRMAIDISQVLCENSLYIDDRQMFVEVAETFGMKGIYYKGLKEVKNELKVFGIEIK